MLPELPKVKIDRLWSRNQRDVARRPLATRRCALGDAAPQRSRGHHAASALTTSIAAGALLVTMGETALAQETYVAAVIATEGAGPLGLGALVGAVVAGAFALRERFRRE